MFTRLRSALAAVVAVLAACAMPSIGHSEILTYTFPVCGAPNSYEPGWVPNGDPMVNGEMTLTIDAEQGLLSLKPSQELLDSIRYPTIHAHLYDLQHRYSNSDLGQSTICWAYYNTEGSRGGTCTHDDYDCQSLTGVTDWPWDAYGYYVEWYRDYIRTVASENADGWWLMLHFAGGHFATDENGRLIEWDGSPFMESSFYGLNQIRTDCNGRVGRTLDNRDFGHGDKCNKMLEGVMADDYFLDANGIAWVDENGVLTEEAIAMGYDLETEYLFFNYRDNGQSDRWGGPDGGAGGFLTGDKEGRCLAWPAESYGEPPDPDDDMESAQLIAQ